MTEKQDAVWLKNQQKTSQSCHKPPDELTAHSLHKYANKCQKNITRLSSHTARAFFFAVTQKVFESAHGAGASFSIGHNKN